jgi:DNA-directed RNA polymerase sigma subunit (sigma70/sigma32)
MPILAVQERSNEQALRLIAETSTSTADPRGLSADIERHRQEGQRHTAAAQEHRAQLRALLQRRDKHITELRAAGWSLARIGTLYKITKERVGQIVATSPSSNSADDAAEVAA